MPIGDQSLEWRREDQTTEAVVATCVQAPCSHQLLGTPNRKDRQSVSWTRSFLSPLSSVPISKGSVT